MTRTLKLVAVALLAAVTALPASATTDVTPLLGQLRMPPGFEIQVYAKVPGARSMAVAEDLGVVFVGTRGSSVYAIVDRNGDGRADSVVRVRDGLKVANGIAWRDGALFIAEQHRVIRLDGGDLPAIAKARPRVLFAGLPDKGWHGWRYAAFGPDGHLYVTIGSPCNICTVKGLEGTIIRLDPEGGTPEIIASGIRNSVGMDFHPGTGDLHFTDNGADNMGDDVPPEEFNRAHEPGLYFGFPYFGGGDARTAQFRGRTPSQSVTMPVITFGAHVAPLGMHFYRGTSFPSAYRNHAFVAQHGSWNRSVPDGYRVVRVIFDETGRATGHEPFIEGWLRDGKAWGRPVDVKELGDGSLLVSDDRAGVIYRVTYGGQ